MYNMHMAYLFKCSPQDIEKHSDQIHEEYS